jgi:2-oxoglutarate dehydrogenase E2 component (dihydrolipoamide succinyltransferase)
MSTQEIEIKVPAVGESISEVFIGEWYAGEGKFVAADKDVVGLETDKATFGIPAPVGGVVTRILKKAGDSASIGEVIGYLQPSDAPAVTAAPAPSPAPVASAPTAPAAPAKAGGHVMPAAASEMAKNNLPAGSVAGTGPGGRVLKEDVIRTVQAGPVRVGGSRETRNVPSQSDSPDDC